MQWSKLKTRIQSLICPELRNRIDFYVTSYRHSHDEADKVWITVDSRRVFECKHYPHQWARAAAYSAGLRAQEIDYRLQELEIHSPADFGNAMRIYLNSSIDEALQCENPLVKAFALVDRRVGKRTLAKLEVSDSEHSLVKTFYALRRGCAHI